MPKFDNILKSYKRKGNVTITHTRIPSKKDENGKTEIYGGSYHVPTDSLKKFHDQYYDAVIKNNRDEYLTEKQLVNGGPILEDFDFRYGTDIDYRVHNEEHRDDIISLYMEKLLEIFDMKPGTSFPIYLFEKDTINMLDDVTKDGIHMIIGIKSDKYVRAILRNSILDDIGLVFEELNLINTYEEVLDEGISKGTTNWQMYGSKKPFNKPYKLVEHYQVNINNPEEEDGLYELEKKSVKVTRELFSKLSAQYSNHIEYKLKESMMDLYNKIKKKGGKKIKIKKNYNKKYVSTTDGGKSEAYKDITSENELDEAIEEWFSQINADDYVLYETHKFLMILGEQYYTDYNNWIKVGLALHNIKLKHTFHDQHGRMFLSWMKFSSQWKKFDWENDIQQHWQTWSNFAYQEKGEGLTEKSIMWWAKESNKLKYKAIKNDTVDYYIQKSQSYGKTAHDIAMVAYQLYKDKFRCVSIKRNEWYEYKNGRWKPLDRGTTLRKLLSTEISQIYSRKTWEEKEKLTAIADQTTETQTEGNVGNVSYNNSAEGQKQEEINNLKSKNQNTKTPMDQAVNTLMKKIHALSDISVMLKQTSSKNNIMTECCELFYEEGFEEKLDANPMLFCTPNGVIDFENKVFRPGRAEDYCSLCNNLQYKKPEENTEEDKKYIKYIKTFMSQLFPNPGLKQYMWEHLATGLIGTNVNQTFNIYNGCGRNGKSVLVKFMEKILGDYKGSVPLQYITQKRPTAGAASPDIAALKGVRYAVIQEPQKGSPLNEGIMKELTGGDEITARKLFSDIIRFTPQFSLVVCTNHLFDIKSNDDGTWRRIRVCEFISKFVGKPSKKEEDYEFLIDKNLEDKLDKWKHMFLQMIVEVGFKTGGVVNDCEAVLEQGKKYRKKQDYFSEYFEERIIKVDIETMLIGKQEVFDDFRNWFGENHGKNMPKGQELYEFLNKKIGTYKKKGWWGYKINYGNVETSEITESVVE